MIRTLVLLGLSLPSLHAGAQTIDCQDIGSRLNALASADQQIRQEWRLMEHDAKATAAERDALQQRWQAVDRDNLAQFKVILAACGWPATKKDSHSAWLLAQHADADLPFQRQARELLAAAVKAGVGEASDLTYLSDRIATKEGRPQEYGTQFSQTDRCSLTLDPVDSREAVNRRRLALGLQSLEGYEAEGRRRLIPADCAAPGAVGKKIVPVKLAANAPGTVRTETCSRPVYPAEEFRQNHGGTVTLRILLGADGKSKKSLIVQSSGYPALDEAARAGLSRCSFNPPLAGGKPVEAWTHYQYVWSTR